MTTTPTPGTGASQTGDARSIGEIVGDVSQDLTTLVRQEIELAKTELKEEAVKAGKGAGMLGGAGLAGYFAILFLSTTLMFMLDEFLDMWAAALIVTVLWAIGTAVLAVIGKKRLRASRPQLPQTQQTLKEDVQWAKAQKN